MIREQGIFKRVAQFIASEDLFSGIHHIDVALSGGADSVCLLAILSALGGDFTLRAHHIRHGLRSDDGFDAEVARCVAQKLGIPFIQTDLMWSDGVPDHDIESRARDARYRALLAAVQDIPSSAIALAHHGDENLETALWRLGRGCGLEGFALAPRRTMGAVELVRPLLTLSKDEIYSFLKQEGLPWAEDPTNPSDHYRRNRIRHHILPQIKAESMDSACLFRSMFLIRRDADALADLADVVAKSQLVRRGDWFCPWAIWELFHRAAKAQILRHGVRYVKSGHCTSDKMIAMALSCIENRVQTKRQVEDGHVHIGWHRGGVSIWTDEIDAFEAMPEILLEIPCQEVQVPPFFTLSAWFSTMESPLRNTTTIFHVNAKCLEEPISLRPASDFKVLYTTRGEARTLREVFASMSIPERWASHWPILCAHDRPLWVLGGMRTQESIPAIPRERALTVCLNRQNFWKC